MENESRLTQNLEELMSLYRHHLDLFWKWIALYVTTVTALLAYVFGGRPVEVTERMAPILIAVCSLGIAFGCMIMWFWLKELQKEVLRISDELKFLHYPSFLGIHMTKGALVTTSILAISSALYAVFGV